MITRANHYQPINEPDGFPHIGGILSDVWKYARSLEELRLRLEAERGRPIEDNEFFAIAKRMGMTML